MIYFSCYWIFRYLKFSGIVILFLIMTALSLMPCNVRGEEFYAYTNKDGIISVTNTPSQENVNYNTRENDSDHDSRYTQENINTDIRKSNSFQDSMPLQGKSKYNIRMSNSYQTATSEERLHWGRDSALIDAKQNKYGKIKKANNGRVMASGIYDVNIKKIANNLYQDNATRIIIKTLYCAELAGRDGSYLDWSGESGELFFIDTNKSCIVKKVYK